MFQPRDHRKHALLLAPFEPRLKADEAVERALLVLLPQLYHGVWLAARMRIDEAHGLERAESQRLPPAGSEDLHRQATLEHQLFFKIVYFGQFRADECVVKGVVLFLRHRAV